MIVRPSAHCAVVRVGACFPWEQPKFWVTTPWLSLPNWYHAALVTESDILSAMEEDFGLNSAETVEGLMSRARNGLTATYRLIALARDEERCAQVSCFASRSLSLRFFFCSTFN